MFLHYYLLLLLLLFIFCDVVEKVANLFHIEFGAKHKRNKAKKKRSINNTRKTILEQVFIIALATMHHLTGYPLTT